MSGWLARLFQKRPDSGLATTPPVSSKPTVPPPAPDGPHSKPADHLLDDPEQIAFLEGLIDTSPRRPLQELAEDDRLFLDGIEQLWRARRLELPVMSQAALRLTDLLRTGEAPLAQYVQLVESDSALTVEVLRSANSAMFAASQPVAHLDAAIRRIGLSRLGSILIMAQLKKKVLSAGVAASKASLLMDLVTPLGVLAADVATLTGRDPQVAFMRGSLLHVEHLVILGAVSEVSRDCKRAVRPTVAGWLETFGLFGPVVREAVATSWHLEHILLGTPDEGDLHRQYQGFRSAVISRWLGRPLPVLPNVHPIRLEAALAKVSPRIAQPNAATAANPRETIQVSA